MSELDGASTSRPDSCHASRFETKELLDKALEKLPEIQKSIILLRDLEGYNYKEIGEILNLGESQVKVYLFRARQQVMKSIQNLSFVL